jgi:coenzyme PQQ precursor peptide PqqA
VQDFATAWGSKSPVECGFEADFISGVGVLISGWGWARLTTRSAFAGTNWGILIMQWTAPAFEEVCLNCEINSYASAKL